MVTSLDNNSFYAVNVEMFGCEWHCLIGDIDHADCYLYIGTNPAVSLMNWMDVNIDGWKRVLRRIEQGADLIVVDPRYTETAQRATMHVPIIPGWDWAFLLGVIKVIFAEGLKTRGPAQMHPVWTDCGRWRAAPISPCFPPPAGSASTRSPKSRGVRRRQARPCPDPDRRGPDAPRRSGGMARPAAQSYHR
ncbi:MAG: molybdopterin-dependent oxidoreductase [Novosphingobium sp.]|nr:molybdopterin-dependent oxidoreductase [Novosphingobium sp.]